MTLRLLATFGAVLALAGCAGKLGERQVNDPGGAKPYQTGPVNTPPPRG